MIRFPISLFALVVLSARQLQSCDGVKDKVSHRKLRPFEGGPPVNIHVGVYVESLGNIREATMDFSLTIYFRERWTDPLLAHNGTHDTIYAGRDSKAIWSPDLFFLYEKNAKKHDVTVANVVVRVNPDGSVFKSSRISVTSSCYMALHRFPFDSQTCSLNIMSYSYATDDITLQIGDDDVDIEPGLTISSFKLQGIRTSNSNVPYSTDWGNFSLAKIDFILQRQMQYFLLTVYIPSILLVVVAWISFFIDAEAAPARVSLGITTVLTITTMTAGIQESLPVATYAKAIDIWLAACLLFVFVALIEYAIANYFLIKKRRREVRKRKLSDSEAEQESKCATYSPSEDRMGQYKTQYYSVETTGKKPSTTNAKTLDPEKQVCPDREGIELHWTADRVDRTAKYSYTILFITFNIIYWPYYLVGL